MQALRLSRELLVHVGIDFMILETDILGKTEEAVVQLLANSTYRIVRRGKVGYPRTMDLKSWRYNLEFDDGVLTKVWMG